MTEALNDEARPAGARTVGGAHYLLFYDYVPDVLARRAPLRDAHLRLARESEARGELVLGGAYAEPVDGAMLLFRCDSAAVVEAFVAADPYVRHGLVTGWRIRRWTTVVGAGAVTPLYPSDAGTPPA
jgi:uncharacterized protein YciI